MTNDLCNHCGKRPKYGTLGWCYECLTQSMDAAAAEQRIGPRPAQDWRCWLPFPPSVNNLFAHAPVKGRIRRFPTRAYKAWRKEAIIRIRSNWRTKPPYAVPVVVKLQLVPADMRPRDADNYGKAVMDALVQAGVLVDDNNRHVKAVVPYWENPADQAGVVVSIRPAEDTRKPALDAAERALLKRVQAGAYTTIPPGFVQPAALWGLLEKGYVETVPGLIEGVPQGYVPA